MIKILFIKPPRGKGPQAVDVPLGILYLSSYLRQYLEGPVDIQLLDLRFTRDIERSLERKLDSFKPDLIGISLMVMDKNFLNEWSGFLRRNAPDAKIVIGGPAATYEYHELLLENREVNWAVVGEGEIVFFNLVKSLVTGGETGRLEGIAYVEGEKVVYKPKTDFIEDLDTLPMPDYSLVHLPDYCSPLSNSINGLQAEKRYAPVISSRGCPYRCIYCHNIFGKKVRMRSPENFLKEIKWLHDEFGIREFHIIDDIFNVDRDRMRKILNLIIASGMKLKLACPSGLRGDILEKEDIDLLKRAGGYILTVAVETASPRMQKLIKKNLNIDKVLENIEYGSRIGLIVRGLFMLGFPGETVAEMRETIALAKRTRLDLASFLIAVPFKGTELAALAGKMYPHVSYEPRGDFWDTKSFYFQATGYDARKLQIYGLLTFYLPFRVFKLFKKLPDKKSLIGIGLWAIKVFFIREHD